MAFLDETGLAELWELIKAEDAKDAKVVTGSYVGTGKSGSGNPTSVTFESKPKVFGFCDANGGIAMGTTYSYKYAILGVTDALTTSYAAGTFLQNMTADTWEEWTNTRYAINYAKVSADGKTLSWYGDSQTSSNPVTDTAKATAQRNVSGTTYRYFAIL